MKNSIRVSLAALSLIVIAGAAHSARADQKADCDAAKKRISWIPGLWHEGNACDLAEDNVAVRPDPWGEGLKNFRAVKAELMSEFDKPADGNKENPYTVGYSLSEIKDKANEYISKHSGDKPETCTLLKDTIAKIDDLNKAVDAMRPDGATNLGRIAAIDHALGSLQDTCTQDRDDPYGKPYCPGTGNGSLEKLDAALQTSTDPDAADLKSKVHAILGDASGTPLGGPAGLVDRLKHIQTCRNYDGQLWADRKLVASAACSGNVAKADAGHEDSQQNAALLKAACDLNPFSSLACGTLRDKLAGVYKAAASDTSTPKPDAVGPGNGVEKKESSSSGALPVCVHADDVLDAGVDGGPSCTPK